MSAIVRILIPLLLTATAVVYAWVKIIITPYIPHWQHYLALLAFVGVLLLFIKSRKAGTIALGIYLVLAIGSVFSLSDGITYSKFGIGPLIIPLGQPLAWGIFIIYFALNMGTLFDYYLDYKESKGTL